MPYIPLLLSQRVTVQLSQSPNCETYGGSTVISRFACFEFVSSHQPRPLACVGMKLSDVKSVRMQPSSSLVPASADPVIGVMHQRMETDAHGRHVLTGELLNESGQVVNIPHVLATYYNNIGQVIWVSDGYVDKALLPRSPIAFSVEIPDDLAAQVQTYRVTVNQYSTSRF